MCTDSAATVNGLSCGNRQNIWEVAACTLPFIRLQSAYQINHGKFDVEHNPTVPDGVLVRQDHQAASDTGPGLSTGHDLRAAQVGL